MTETEFNQFQEAKNRIDELERVYEKAYRQGFEDCKSKVNGILN